MKKIAFIFLASVVGIIIVLGVAGYIKFHFAGNKEVISKTNVPVKATDPKNIAYNIDGKEITLINGKFEHPAAPDSAAKETYMLFGEPVYGDLDGDGDLDAVTYLTRDGGGSGTFFYVVAAVNASGTYRGTNAMFLGDRIAPQNINFINGKFVANFAERRMNEPFTVRPSIGKSVWIHLDQKTNQIGELVQNFEGEADPSTMSLVMKKWNWVSTNNFDGTIVLPKKANVFTITFSNNGTFSGTTDCNGVGGEYVGKGDALAFNKMMSTLMFCEGSQEQEFTSMLGSVEAYHFTNKGELIFELPNKGTAVFR